MAEEQGGSENAGGGAGAGSGAGAGAGSGGDAKPNGGGKSGADALGGGGGTGSDSLTEGKQGQTSSEVPDWAKEFTPERRNLVVKKGWKTQDEVFESYTQLESKLGAGPNELLRIPKEGDEAALNEFYTKLGRPAKAEDYKSELKFEEGQPNFLDWFRKAAYAEGLSQKAFERLSSGFEQQRVEFESQIMGVEVAKSEAALGKLKAEWGNAWDSNLSLARTGAKALGFDQNVLVALERTMGTEGMMKAMLRVGLSTSSAEGGSHGNNQSTGGMTAAEARAEIERINSDHEAMRAWNDPGASGHASMKQKMDRLFAIAYPET